jgi:hypothetical protein
MVQINRVVRQLGVTDDAGPTRLQLSTPTPGGYFAAYAAQIDNVTNDPRTLLPVQISSDGQRLLLLPSSARIGGFNGAFFTTGLTLFNPASQEMSLRLKFLGNNHNGSQGDERSVTLASGQSASYDDVLGEVFGLAEGFGAIQITASYVPGDLLPVVQSYTSTPNGTGGSYGQSVPAVPRIGSLFLGAQRSVVGIREDAAFRSNLILANLSVTQVDVDITLVDEAGVALGSKRIPLQPQGMTQLNRVVRELGVAGDVSGARLLLSTPTFGGAFAAYVALIDNTTNDPRTLLPQ